VVFATALVGLGVGAASGTNAGTENTVLASAALPCGLAFDAAGDLFIANSQANTLTVVPSVSGTIFGQSVTANEATLLNAATGLDDPHGLAFDQAGDLFVSDLGNKSVTVVPNTSGTIFGQSVTADQSAVLSAARGLFEPEGIAVDSAGDLFIANGASVTVVPESSGMLFGESVTADQSATLVDDAASSSKPEGLAFDAAGNLYIGSNINVTVLARTSTTLFGQSVTADVQTQLNAANQLGVIGAMGLAFDSAGDLYVGEGQPLSNVLVVPKASGTLFDQSVIADDTAKLDAAIGLDNPAALAFDGAGNLYIANDNYIGSGATTALTIVPATDGIVFNQSVTANDATALDAATGVADPLGIAFDSAGNLYVPNSAANTVTVVPKSSGTLFGQSVSAGAATPLSAAAGLVGPWGLAFDSAGNLYISNFGNNTVTVVPKSSGTLFGQSVTANTATVLVAATGLDSPTGLAFDSAGDLFIANRAAALTIVPKSSGTVFGRSVTANTATAMAWTGFINPTGLAFDSAGNLFLTVDNSASASYPTTGVSVIAQRSGTLFGESVTANTATVLNMAGGLENPIGLVFDSAGDLYIADNENNTIVVVPKSSGTVFGQSVTADVATTLNAAAGLNSPGGVAVDSADDLYVAGGNVLDEVIAAAPQRITFTSAAPVGATVGEGSYTPIASASSGLAVTITLDPSSTGCTLSGGVVSFDASGTCVLDAEQGGTAVYAPAPEAQQSFVVNGAAPPPTPPNIAPPVPAPPPTTAQAATASVSVLPGPLVAVRRRVLTVVAGSPLVSFPLACSDANCKGRATLSIARRVNEHVTHPIIAAGSFELSSGEDKLLMLKSTAFGRRVLIVPSTSRTATYRMTLTLIIDGGGTSHDSVIIDVRRAKATE
jgi:sugar lactone lactonase YvrE